MRDAQKGGLLTRPTLARKTRLVSGKAAASSATEAYSFSTRPPRAAKTAQSPGGTLQGDGRLRTLLADFFSILLTSRATPANRGSSKAPNRDLAPYNRG